MQLFANNADSLLDGAIAADSASIALKAGDGAKFPSPTGGDYFLATLFQKIGTSELNYEIVKVTARVGDVLTVVRAQEGTTAQAYSNGDRLELRATAAAFQNLVNDKVDKVAGKGLSTEDYSTTEKAKLAGVAPGATQNSSDAALIARDNHTGTQPATTISDFAAAVRGSVLSGLSSVTNATIATTDTVLAAFGKLQAQVSEKYNKTGGDIAGNLGFTGTARRIRFPYVALPVISRLLFQSSDENSSTYIGVIPSGTAKSAGITFSNSSDPDNAGYGYLLIDENAMALSSSVALGTGGTGGTPGAVPLVLLGRSASMSIGDGAVAVTNGTLGYGAGAGGTVTQTGSRTSGVVLNKPSGQITLVSAAGSPSWLSFTLTNSSISSTDGVVVTQLSGTDLYVIAVTAVATGSCRITFVTNGGTTTEQPVFNFQVVKGAAS